MEEKQCQVRAMKGGVGAMLTDNCTPCTASLSLLPAPGDMPVALMVDGPSLGGFVCPATITSTELWKMGQVRPGDSVCFVKQTIEEVSRPAHLFPGHVAQRPCPVSFSV